MKKFKKLIALTCIATMLVPTVAFAADGQTTPAEITMTGNSVVENDNSKDYEYTSVVLPTTNDTTYSFQIDRDGLLSKYDTGNTYMPSNTVYFNAENEAATLALKDASTYDLYEIGKEVYIAKDSEKTTVETSDLGAALKGQPVATDLSTLIPAATYYVWTPITKTDNGAGQWTELTSTNIGDYLKLTDDGTNYTSVELQPDPLSGEHIWDGNIYVIEYTKIIDFEKAVVDHNVVADGSNVITSLDDKLYVHETADDATDLTTYTLVDTSNAATYITYTAATECFNGTSDKAIVENKSTTAIAVSVDVKVTAAGLTFSADGDYNGADDSSEEDDDAAASVYFTVGNGTTSKALDENGAATIYYVLDGANNDYETFQGSTFDNETGSHNYYKYEKPNVSYESQSFVLSATANALDASDEAWTEYVAALEAGEIDKPTIEVVYNWTPVEIIDEAEFVYEDEDGKTYDAVSATDGWATTAILTTTIAGNTYSVGSSTNTYTITWKDGMTEDNKKITSIQVGTSSSEFYGNVVSGAYSLSGTTLTIDAVKNSSVMGAGGIGLTRYLKVNFADGSSALITLSNITA